MIVREDPPLGLPEVETAQAQSSFTTAQLLPVGVRNAAIAQPLTITARPDEATTAHQDPVMDVRPGGTPPATGTDIAETRDAVAEEQALAKKRRLEQDELHALFHRCWGDHCELSEGAEACIKNATLKKQGRDYFEFKLESGGLVGWHENFQGKGEFIGKTGWGKFDDLAAKAVIAMCKSRGWEQVELTGTPETKMMMWKEAMREGIDVKDFRPSPEQIAQLKEHDPETYKHFQEMEEKKARNKMANVEDPAGARSVAEPEVLPPQQAPQVTAQPQEPTTIDAVAQPDLSERKAALAQKLQEEAEKSPFQSQKTGTALLCAALITGNVDFDAQSLDAIESKMKPRYLDKNGLVETGNGYNRVAEYAAENGLVMPQIGQSEWDDYRTKQQVGDHVIGWMANTYDTLDGNRPEQIGMVQLAAAVRQDKAMFTPNEFENMKALYEREGYEGLAQGLLKKGIDLDGEVQAILARSQKTLAQEKIEPVLMETVDTTPTATAPVAPVQSKIVAKTHTVESGLATATPEETQVVAEVKNTQASFSAEDRTQMTAALNALEDKKVVSRFDLAKAMGTTIEQSGELLKKMEKAGLVGKANISGFRQKLAPPVLNTAAPTQTNKTPQP